MVNLPVNIVEEEDEELRTMLAQLEYGNKISILGWEKDIKYKNVGGQQLAHLQLQLYAKEFQKNCEHTFWSAFYNKHI